MESVALFSLEVAPPEEEPRFVSEGLTLMNAEGLAVTAGVA
jgi:hypothetical protein